MLVGNDFLPHLVHLDIADGSLNMMMNTYKDMLPSLGGYLTDKTKVHLPRFELFMRELSKYEPPYFERRARDEAQQGGGVVEGGEFDARAYAAQYYQDKFGWPANDPETLTKRRKLVDDYITGLCWVLE